MVGKDIWVLCLGMDLGELGWADSNSADNGDNDGAMGVLDKRTSIAIERSS